MKQIVGEDSLVRGGTNFDVEKEKWRLNWTTIKFDLTRIFREIEDILLDIVEFNERIYVEKIFEHNFYTCTCTFRFVSELGLTLMQRREEKWRLNWTTMKFDLTRISREIEDILLDIVEFNERIYG